MKTGVITSDIIQSTTISPAERERLYKLTQESLLVIQEQFPHQSEWYRGDAFQIKTENVKHSCRVALLVKTFIRSIEKGEKTKNTPKIYDVRMALGIGAAEPGRDTLALSNGEAFQLSGRTLDMLKTTRYNFAITTNDSHKNALRAEAQLLDTLISSTTAAQCRVLYYKLLGYIEDEIAKKLSVSQSTVNQHANAANWSVFDDYLDYFENLYAHG